jgi:hypothetical protein
MAQWSANSSGSRHKSMILSLHLVLNRCEMYSLLDKTRPARSREVVRSLLSRSCRSTQAFSLPFLGYHNCDLDPELRPGIAIDKLGPLAAQAA